MSLKANYKFPQITNEERFVYLQTVFDYEILAKLLVNFSSFNKTFLCKLTSRGSVLVQGGRANVKQIDFFLCSIFFKVCIYSLSTFQFLFYSIG